MIYVELCNTKEAIVTGTQPVWRNSCNKVRTAVRSQPLDCDLLNIGNKFDCFMK